MRCALGFRSKPFNWYDQKSWNSHLSLLWSERGDATEIMTNFFHVFVFLASAARIRRGLCVRICYNGLVLELQRVQGARSTARTRVCVCFRGRGRAVSSLGLPAVFCVYYWKSKCVVPKTVHLIDWKGHDPRLFPLFPFFSKRPPPVN